jgi:hypothetical protein
VKRGADDRPVSGKRDVATSSTFVISDADPQQLGRNKSQWTPGWGHFDSWLMLFYNNVA